MSKHARIICAIIWIALIIIGAFVSLAIRETDWLYTWGFFIGTFSFIFMTLTFEGRTKKIKLLIKKFKYKRKIKKVK